MALTCNSFANNTLGQTQQTAACRAPHVANLSDHELLPEQFMLLVLDTIVRTSAGLRTLLQTVPACDLAEVLRNASCALITNTPAYPLTPADLQAQILYLLNELQCAGE